MVRKSSCRVKSIVVLCSGLGVVAGLSAQPSITTTVTGKLGSIIAGNGAVTAGSYVSGITATGSAGQTCKLSITGAGTGATATAKLTGTDSVGSGPLSMVDWGTGYTTPPTTATVISGGTANCTGTSVVVATSLNDPLQLNNQTFTATVTGINPIGVTYNSNSITYNNVSVTVAAGGVSGLNCTGATSTITVKDASDGGYDTLKLSNCNINALAQGTLVSTIALPAGSLPAPIPMPFHAGLVSTPTTASQGTYTIITTNSPVASTTLGITGGVTAVCNNCPNEVVSPAG